MKKKRFQRGSTSLSHCVETIQQEKLGGVTREYQSKEPLVEQRRFHSWDTVLFQYWHAISDNNINDGDNGDDDNADDNDDR